jgi:hypothetical protein
VSDPVEPIRFLLSDWAVLHGSPDTACLAALEADGLPEQMGGTGEDVSALIPLAEPEVSWLFRRVRDDASSTPELEYRIMSCRFDAKLEVPSEVLGAPGTSVPVTP